MLVAAEQVDRDGSGRVRRRYRMRNGRLDGIVSSYDQQGYVLRSASYRDGQLHGEELLYGDAGGVLCGISAVLVSHLERRELTDDLREAFASEQLALFDDARIAVVEPEREYLVAQAGQSFTLRVGDSQLEVYPGRLICRTSFQDDWIVSRMHFKGGQPDGESTIYGPAGVPLFALDPAFRDDLDNGAIKTLQPAFKQHGQLLAGDALIAKDMAGTEWRIIQPERTLTIRHMGAQLAVFPGRVTQRAIFVDGWLVETAHYSAGQLDGIMTLYGRAGAMLFDADLDLRHQLDAGQVLGLLPHFLWHGYPLSAEAVVSTVVGGVEWFVADLVQTYTIRRMAHRLGVFPGRAISQTSYRHGKLDGETVMYDDEGAPAQRISYRSGLLHGPMLLYVGGVKQTLVSFRDGKKNGDMIAYDHRGHETTVSRYRDDRLDGEMWLYQEGQARAMTTYRGGIQHGPAITYHANGRESLVARYANGLLDGESLLYSEEGQLLKSSVYADGWLQGVVVEYFPSGTVRRRLPYRNDQLDGIVYIYDEQGNLKEKRHYRDGELIGKPEQRSWRQILAQR